MTIQVSQRPAPATRATAIIPENAPFDADQRAWLNGFFAGLLSLDAGAVAPDTAPAKAKGDGDDGAAPWHDPALEIDDRMKLAEGRPFPRKLMAAMAQQDCGQCGYMCDTYADAIAEQAEPRLNLCVPGGKATARMLKTLVESAGGGVLDPDTKAAKEAKAAAKQPVSSEAGLGRSREAPVVASFLRRRKLNGDGSEKATYHIDCDLSASGLDYTVGDSLGVFPTNDSDLVDAVIAAIHAPPDFPIAGKSLRHTLLEDMALSPAPDSLFEFLSYLTGGDRRKKAKALAKGEDPDGDAATLDVLAALEKFSGLRPDPEAFIESLEPLQPRLYSISSSPKAVPGQVSLTVDAVRYLIGARERLGAASTHLGARIAPGAPLKVYVQKAHGFALPADGRVPIIMVGPGTGVAPFRAFLQERAATRAQGPAWLFFGHQRRATDFFYEDELGDLQARGALTTLSLAWSRDGERKVYVQDRMRDEGAALFRWLEQGAHFYVCGDAKRMAKDVETALTDIVAEHGGKSADGAKAYVAELRKVGRYQADVY